MPDLPNDGHHLRSRASGVRIGLIPSRFTTAARSAKPYAGVALKRFRFGARTSSSFITVIPVSLMDSSSPRQSPETILRSLAWASAVGILTFQAKRNMAIVRMTQ